MLTVSVDLNIEDADPIFQELYHFCIVHFLLSRLQEVRQIPFH
jgi:hypothetical protein